MSELDYDNIELFTGKEVEHTPVYGMQTLFVNGKTKVKEILKHAVEHVYMGANHCDIDVDNPKELLYYNRTISKLLDAGLWVTVDYDAQHHDAMLKALSTKIWQNKKFIPMISVHLPKVDTINPNLTIKIADKEFQGENGGVWCLNMQDIPKWKYTPWVDYTNDELISYKEN